MTDVETFPTVTVVVPAYQAAATLADCLESLTRLDYPRERLELICVDNDSSDETAAIIRRFAPVVTALSESRRGASAARNRGLAHARGDIVAFTDADCTVAPSWLTSLIRPLADVRVGIAGGRILAMRPCNWIERFGERIHDHAKAISATEPPYVISMNWASRRDVLAHYGGFDETLLRCQDVDLSFRIARGGLTLAYVHDAVVYHRNERSLAGLFHEGYVHGYNAGAVQRLHHDYLAGFPASYTTLRRLLQAMARTFRETWSARDTLLQLLFDSGKVRGAARAARDSVAKTRRLADRAGNF
jgi:cellulose synthase/poly-beta-1,6-N-acetylglucosamine synthase-like glycosyltransferase